MNAYEQLLTWVATIHEARQGIGKLFVQARFDLEMNRAQLAKALCITPVHVSNIEQGKGYPSLELMKRLLRLLKHGTADRPVVG